LGVYSIALECLSKLFYSFFSVFALTGRRLAAVFGAGTIAYSNMKRRMLTFISKPTHMATVMVDEPP
jgi:hypothetical protein